MSIEAHYRDELNYLREMGALFARSNPQLAPYLGEDASDPDVERLLEGFAFLVGRLTDRLDAEFPELAQDLLRLIAPHYLRPVPPVTTLQFRATDAAGGATIRVARGTTVQTAPIEGEGIRFRTGFDIVVMPFEIAAVELENRDDGCLFTLTFNCRPGARLQALREAPLDLFFNGRRDPATARLLYLFFMEHVGSVQFTPKGGASVKAAIRITPRGSVTDEATLPCPDGGFSGFRFLQEYLACPETLLHARITGLESFAEVDAEGFTLAFEMTRRFGGTAPLGPELFALNATPAVNLFEADGQPFLLSDDRAEYPIRPLEGTATRSVQAIESVAGYVGTNGERIEYEPFERFRHDQGGEVGPSYRTRLRPSFAGGLEHHISFGMRGGPGASLRAETITTRLTCSNGPIVSRVGVGAVSRPGPNTPARLIFSNITPVTSEAPAPVHDAAIWTLIAALPRNFGSLADIGWLRAVLAAHDFRGACDRQSAKRRDLLLQSMVQFERRSVDVIRRGRPVRTQEFLLRLADRPVGGEGEMYLLGSVLNRFLKSYAGINSLHSFSIAGNDSGTTYRWAPAWGESAAL